MINASYTIVATNDAAARLFGIRGLSLRGMGVEAILPGITGTLKNSLSSGAGIHSVEENFILGTFQGQARTGERTTVPVGIGFCVRRHATHQLILLSISKNRPANQPQYPLRLFGIKTEPSMYFSVHTSELA